MVILIITLPITTHLHTVTMYLIYISSHSVSYYPTISFGQESIGRVNFLFSLDTYINSLSNIIVITLSLLLYIGNLVSTLLYFGFILAAYHM